ncbi:hypothetical protein VJ918_05720 [Adlercreutzia sp. R21]|uniref:Sortase n=1 Tax=Adlercreutzia wanghongyangiae TaxID=3111451 RepID=A0ABU6IID3_9ACTN|nr:hypothetical protein [Adlercreutzia sp. R21]MEC4176221.1 hypothetical protein [Adlercreutzia sp. R7]MEC4184305.1 hypothetical protein [Adlercreutzia sp. R21]
MKAPKVFAAALTSVAALCLAGGMAYALEPALDPTMKPIPDAAADTSITKQVVSIIVYEDQEEAVAMATEFGMLHDELALEAVSSRASVASQHSAAHDQASQAASTLPRVDATADESEGDDATMDAEHPLAMLSDESAVDDGAMKPDTIDVNGDVMPYIDSFETASAPSSGAGLWMGSDSTTDGSWGYFIGHNPGSFTCVMTLKNGDPVTVCDGEGASRTYHVVDEFIVPDDTYWEDIRTRVTEYGESIILQTCCGDNAHYRVVIAN